MNIICVYNKIGNKDFNEKYVLSLLNICRKKIKEEFAFICYTNDINFFGKISNIVFKPLINNYSGYWAKLEIFNIKGACLYFDLDTVIVDDIQFIAEEIKSLKETQFLAMKKFNAKRWEKEGMFTSGVMGWNGDFSFLSKEFNYLLAKEKYHGDADIIQESLASHNIEIKYIQDIPNHGLYSYKWHCREKLPKDSKVVCFHGQPRPHQVAKQVSWVESNWQS